jgi:hypothetical protein
MSYIWGEGPQIPHLLRPLPKLDITSFKRSARVVPQHSIKHWGPTLDLSGSTTALLILRLHIITTDCTQEVPNSQSSQDQLC